MLKGSILAGFVIGIGAIVNCAIGGGPVGAVAFSIGLIAVLTQQMNLFTGKAGLLASSQISVLNLLIVWVGNFLGTAISSLLVLHRQDVSQVCFNITQNKIAAGYEVNVPGAILCGVLMYVAVNGYQKTKSFIPAIFGVAAFILGGFNHCIADMFYFLSSGISFWAWLPILLAETAGNIIGCNLIPLLQKGSLYD